MKDLLDNIWTCTFGFAYLLNGRLIDHWLRLFVKPFDRETSTAYIFGACNYIAINRRIQSIVHAHQSSITIDSCDAKESFAL